MSSPTDPTRRLPRPLRRDRVAYVEPDERLWREEVFARLRGLSGATMIVAVLAVGALGVGLWALFADADDGRDAGVGRVHQLEQRVQVLEASVRRGPSADQLSSLRERIQALDARLQAVSERLDQPSTELEATRDALEGTQASVEQLQQRVDELEQQQDVQPLP
jgi:hypothetical protein